MSIHVLPQAAVRAIGSSQALTETASVVKELIDNAIDARATSISIEISVNTLDVIQVRDNGHGIAPADRALVAKRYCTSKITNEKDLATIGGSFLGFRGEALSSAAEMSGSISITTRVEGEGIATTLKFDSDGEVLTRERASHPVGTTVRIIDFLKNYPVRKQVAMKGVVKTIAKIKQVLHSYAFARPAIRLSFRVLKANHDRDNWTYAPNAGADVKGAALKVEGKPCVDQCNWYEVESDGFGIQAYLPRIDAELNKCSNAGQFLSVDGRPVNTTRGVFRQVVKIFKDSLNRANANPDGTKNPFMYIGFTCPTGSYDPNVEPAKDDVMFENNDVVLAAVRKILEVAYPAITASEQLAYVPSRTEQYGTDGRTARSPTEVIVEKQGRSLPEKGTAYKTNMYDMDEDDLELMASMIDDHAQEPPEAEGEEDLGPNTKPLFSNPWVMAKMNGRIGKTNLGHLEQTQLMTPSREANERPVLSSSPIRANAASATQQLLPPLPTPGTSSPTRRVSETSSPQPGDRSIELMDRSTPRQHLGQHLDQRPALDFETPTRISYQQSQSTPVEMSHGDSPRLGSRLREPQIDNQGGMALSQIPEAITHRRPGLRSEARQRSVNKPFKSPTNPERDAWFAIEPEQTLSHPRRVRQQKSSLPSLVPSGEPSGHSQRDALSPPSNNQDIRTFISAKRALPDTVDSDLPELIVIDENTAPTDLTSGATIRASRPRDFIPASELDLINEPPSPPLNDTSVSSRAPRRRKTGERTLVEITSNSRIEESHELLNDPRPRCTTTTSTNITRAPHRTKSSQLPLERTPPDLQIQNAVLLSSFAKEDLAVALSYAAGDKTLLALREPAVDGPGVLTRASEAEVRTWTTKLKVLLETRFPGRGMPGDLGAMVRDGLGRADEWIGGS